MNKPSHYPSEYAWMNKPGHSPSNMHGINSFICNDLKIT